MCLFSEQSVRLHLHSFPTRRSSDLFDGRCPDLPPGGDVDRDRLPHIGYVHHAVVDERLPLLAYNGVMRSEEHTSELQSHHDLVCRLLLEKKNSIKLIQASAVFDTTE